MDDGVDALSRKSSKVRHGTNYLSLMLGKPRIRLNNLKNSLRFPCLHIIDSIIILIYRRYYSVDNCYTQNRAPGCTTSCAASDGGG